MILDADTLAAVLAELARRADEAGIEATIHVVGGAAIALRYNPERQATRDVDAWLNAREHAKRRLLDIAARLADERGWPDDWLNERAAVFIPDAVGGAGSADWYVVFDARGVQVTVANEQILFAMKLRAARGRRDFPDAAVLAAAAGVTTIDEAVELYDRYYPDDALKDAARDWLAGHFAPDGN